MARIKGRDSIFRGADKSSSGKHTCPQAHQPLCFPATAASLKPPCFFPRAAVVPELQRLPLCSQARGYDQPDSGLDSPSSSPAREGTAAGQLRTPGKASAAPGTHPATTGPRTAPAVHVPRSTVPIHVLGGDCFASSFCFRCPRLSEAAVSITCNLYPLPPGNKKAFVFQKQFVMRDPKPNHTPA